MSCLSHFYRHDGLSVLASQSNLSPILYQCKHNCEDRPSEDVPVNPFFKFKKIYSVTCCSHMAIIAAQPPLRGSYVFYKHFIKIKRSDCRQTLSSLPMFGFTLKKEWTMRSRSGDNSKEVIRCLSVTTRPRWARHAPTVKQESHNWPMTLLVLVYHWLWWVSGCYRQWMETRLNLQSRAVVCETALFACNLTVGNMCFADAHESLN